MAETLHRNMIDDYTPGELKNYVRKYPNDEYALKKVGEMLQARMNTRRRLPSKHKVTMKKKSGMAETLHRNMIGDYTPGQLKNYVRKYPNDEYALKKVGEMLQVRMNTRRRLPSKHKVPMKKKSGMAETLH